MHGLIEIHTGSKIIGSIGCHVVTNISVSPRLKLSRQVYDIRSGYVYA